MIRSIIKTLLNNSKKVNSNSLTYTAPLGITPNSLVTISEIPIALAQVDGSLVKSPISDIVTAIGKYKFYDLTVHRIYLGDNGDYLGIVETTNGLELTYWSHYDEIFPKTRHEWENWLGFYERDLQGQVIRDKLGNSRLTEYGLIGWPQFQIDQTPPIVYDRLLEYSVASGVLPVPVTETIFDKNSSEIIINHNLMEYWRPIRSSNASTQQSTLSEFLSVSQSSESNGSSSINIHVGIFIDVQDVKILQV